MFVTTALTTVVVRNNYTSHVTLKVDMSKNYTRGKYFGGFAARQRRHSIRSSFARVGAGAEHKALAVLGTHAYAHVCSMSHADCVQSKIPGSGWSQSTSSMPDVHQVCYCRRIRSVVREHGL